MLLLISLKIEITHIHSSIIHKTQEVPTTQVSTDGAWINEMRHVMEYRSVLKRKKILLPVTTWMTLEDFMLGEIRQLPKRIYTSNRNTKNKKKS